MRFYLTKINGCTIHDTTTINDNKFMGLYCNEALSPSAAAKKFGEQGFKGEIELMDDNGIVTKWDIGSTVLHYAYPIKE